MSYTGIAAIDIVLCDLYSERYLLEKALEEKPNSKVLKQRLVRVVGLTGRLIDIGWIFQAVSNSVPEFT